MTAIRFRRGNKADLPVSAPSGTPLWCEDSNELYIGTGIGINKVGSDNYPITPYSAASGPQNASGYADFISKIDNDSVSINGASTNIVIIYPDCTQEKIDVNIIVSSTLDNAITTFIKEKDNVNIQKCTGTITESILPPSGGVDGDYWLCFGIKPYQGYKKISETWTPMQFVKLGEVTKTSGVLGTPISYAFNGTYIIQPGTLAGGKVILNHNIGSQCIARVYVGILSNGILTNYSQPLRRKDAGNDNDMFDTVIHNINKLTADCTFPSLDANNQLYYPPLSNANYSTNKYIVIAERIF